MGSQPPGTTLVFYDGICGLCNRLNRFLLKRDRQGQIRFAPLQSRLARDTLARYGRDSSDLDTVYVVSDWNSPRERVHARSRAVLHTLSLLGPGWRLLSRLGSIVPTPLADALYGLVARHRYRIFGQFDACPLPPPEWRTRFLDQP